MLLVRRQQVWISLLLSRMSGMEAGLLGDLGTSSRIPGDSHHLPLCRWLPVLMMMLGISIKAGISMMVLPDDRYCTRTRKRTQFMIRKCWCFTPHPFLSDAFFSTTPMTFSTELPISLYMHSKQDKNRRCRSIHWCMYYCTYSTVCLFVAVRTTNRKFCFCYIVHLCAYRWRCNEDATHLRISSIVQYWTTSTINYDILDKPFVSRIKANGGPINLRIHSSNKKKHHPSPVLWATQVLKYSTYIHCTYGVREQLAMHLDRQIRTYRSTVWHKASIAKRRRVRSSSWLEVARRGHERIW